jgi:hypothetical protein
MENQDFRFVSLPETRRIIKLIGTRNRLMNVHLKLNVKLYIMKNSKNSSLAVENNIDSSCR